MRLSTFYDEIDIHGKLVVPKVRTSCNSKVRHVLSYEVTAERFIKLPNDCEVLCIRTSQDVVMAVLTDRLFIVAFNSIPGVGNLRVASSILRRVPASIHMISEIIIFWVGCCLTDGREVDVSGLELWKASVDGISDSRFSPWVTGEFHSPPPISISPDGLCCLVNDQGFSSLQSVFGF